MLVVGLGFKARSGKNTVASTIASARGIQYDIRQYAFADELKREYTEAVEADIALGATPQEAVRRLCGWANEQCAQNGHSFRVVYDPAPDMSDPQCPYGKQRTLLQWWGSEYRRAQSPFYWISKLERTLRADNPQVALITDLRFPNEFHWIRNRMGGVVVKVTRFGFDNGLTHQSEKLLDGYKFDYEVIVGPDNLDELKRDAVELFDVIAQDCIPGPTAEQLAEFSQSVLRETANV